MSQKKKRQVQPEIPPAKKKVRGSADEAKNNAGGKITLSETGFPLDITERVQAERFMKDLFAKNPISIQVLDKQGFTLEVNPAYKALFGSVPPADYSIFNDPQLAQKGMGAIFAQLKNGEVVHFPDVNFNPHDSIPERLDDHVWVRTVGFRISDDHGTPERFILMHENITARKQTEEVLRADEERFALVVEASEQGIWDWNVETNEVFYSEQWKKQIGYEDNELENDFNTWVEHLHPNESEYC